MDGHVSKEKLSDVLKVFEALKEETTLEEEKETQINVINKLLDCLLNDKECEHKYQLLDSETTSFILTINNLIEKYQLIFIVKCLDIQYQKKEIREE